MTISPNRESRHGTKIDSIVLHSTWGGFSGSVAHLCNTASRASAHYVIGRDGTIATLVPDEDAAWHVRREATHQVNPPWNARSIGIELVDDQMENGWMTDQQYGKLVLLVKVLVQRWGIPLNRDRIKMHKELDAKSDPKGWTDVTINHLIDDVSKLINPIIEDEEMTPEQFKAINDAQKMANLIAIAAGNVKMIKPDPNNDACFFEKDGRRILINNGDLVTNGLDSWEKVNQTLLNK